MRYTKAQVISLTGVTVERLRHWGRSVPDLARRDKRRPTFSFEEMALIAVLDCAADQFAVKPAHIAADYAELLAAFSDDDAVGSPDTVLWFSEAGLVLGGADEPPPGKAIGMVRIELVLKPLIAELTGERPSSQLRLSF